MLTFPTETSSSFKITWHETEQERKFNQRQSFFISLFISQMTFLFVSLINKTCGYKGFSLVKNLFSKYFIASLGYNTKNKENHKKKFFRTENFPRRPLVFVHRLKVIRSIFFFVEKRWKRESEKWKMLSQMTFVVDARACEFTKPRSYRAQSTDFEFVNENTEFTF